MTIKGHVLDVLAGRPGVTRIMLKRQKGFEALIIPSILDRRNVESRAASDAERDFL